MRIFIFGDSIAQGFYDSAGGWAQRIANELHQATLASMLKGVGGEFEVFNLGISGDTVVGLLDRIERETETRRLYEDKEVIIIGIGMNDVVLRENLEVMDVYKFQEYIEKLSKKALAICQNVIFVGLTAVDESLADPWKFSSSGKQWKNERINLFEDTLKQCAEQSELFFVPIHDQFIAELQAGKNLLSDGLHPNDEGHILIANAVKAKLSELKI